MGWSPGSLFQQTCCSGCPLGCDTALSIGRLKLCLSSGVSVSLSLLLWAENVAAVTWALSHMNKIARSDLVMSMKFLTLAHLWIFNFANAYLWNPSQQWLLLPRKHLKNNSRVNCAVICGDSAGNNGNCAVSHVSRVMIVPDCSPINLCHCSSPGREQAGHIVKGSRHFEGVPLWPPAPKELFCLSWAGSALAGRILGCFLEPSSRYWWGRVWGRLPQREE